MKLAASDSRPVAENFADCVVGVSIEAELDALTDRENYWFTTCRLVGMFPSARTCEPFGELGVPRLRSSPVSERAIEPDPVNSGAGTRFAGPCTFARRLRTVLRPSAAGLEAWRNRGGHSCRSCLRFRWRTPRYRFLPLLRWNRCTGCGNIASILLRRGDGYPDMRHENPPAPPYSFEDGTVQSLPPSGRRLLAHFYAAEQAE